MPLSCSVLMPRGCSRETEHPWDEMGQQTQQCQAGPSPCRPSLSPTPRQAPAQHNWSARPHLPSAPPLDTLAKDFGRHIPDFSTSSPSVFLWFILAAALERTSEFSQDLSQGLPQRPIADPIAIKKGLGDNHGTASHTLRVDKNTPASQSTHVSLCPGMPTASSLIQADHFSPSRHHPYKTGIITDIILVWSYYKVLKDVKLKVLNAVKEWKDCVN